VTFIIGSGFGWAQSCGLQVCGLGPVDLRTNGGLVASSAGVRPHGEDGLGGRYADAVYPRRDVRGIERVGSRHGDGSERPGGWDDGP
jgi:hypothetical protein